MANSAFNNETVQFPIQLGVKTLTSTVNNSTVYQVETPATGLGLNVVAPDSGNDYYDFEAIISFSNEALITTKYRFSVTNLAGAILEYTTVLSQVNTTASLGTELTSSFIGSRLLRAYGKLLVPNTATDGILRFEWGQNVAVANDSSVRFASSIKLTKIASEV